MTRLCCAWRVLLIQLERYQPFTRIGLMFSTPIAVEDDDDHRVKGELMSNIIALPSAALPVKTHYLHDVNNDSRTRLYFGYSAVASVTGAPVSQVKDAFRLAIHGPNWVHNRHTPAIMHVDEDEIQSTLLLLGYVGEWHEFPKRPSLAAFLSKRTGLLRSHPCIVFLRGYQIAISGGVLCDARNGGVVVDIDDAPGRRCRIHKVFVLTHRVPPKMVPSKSPSGVDPSVGLPKEAGLRKKQERLFREAVKIETFASRVKVENDEVFIKSKRYANWHYIGGLKSIQKSLLAQGGSFLHCHSEQATQYRSSMGL